jgi:hypothetical protein
MHRRTAAPARHNVRGLHLVVIGVLLVLALAAGGARSGAAHPARLQPAAEEATVVRIRAADFAATRRLASWGLDMLEMRDGDDVLAIVSPRQQAALRAAGWDVRPAPDHTALLQRPALRTFQQGYRTVEEIEQFLSERAASYPHLATLEDIGDSWQRWATGGDEGYNLLALRLTSQDTPGPKPVFFVMAAIHAREIATPEIATRFIDYLLAGYGSNAEATWLLDAYEIVVVPMVNPDGHKLAEQGYSQRKNINPLYGGSCLDPPTRYSQYGVDLNRNFSLGWGTVNTPGTHPCRLTFPGGAPASEPETQAIETFIRTLYPDRPRPISHTLTLTDTSGVLLSLHSYGELVLWPWGFQETPPPDEAALTQLGTRIAQHNGYVPQSARELYAASGTTSDWAYGELGIASYTLEIGPPPPGECAGFMPPYACLDSGMGGDFWGHNLPALLYAARVTQAPYMQPAGPDPVIHHIATISDTGQISLTVTLATDPQQPFEAADLYIGQAPWHGGAAIALAAAGPPSAQGWQQWRASLPADAFAAACAPTSGIHCRNTDIGTVPLLLVQGHDKAGNRGPVQAAWPTMVHSSWLPLVRGPG